MELKILIRLSLIGISFAVIANGEINSSECPNSKEYNGNTCLCYQDDKYLMCDSIEKPFKFEKLHTFNLVTLKNLKSYGVLLDETNSVNNFKTSLLNLLQDQEIVARQDLDDFETVLQLPTQGIKIVLTPENNQQIIDIEKLNKDIETISLTNIGKVINSDPNNLFQEFKLLKTLHLENVNFSNTKNMAIFDSSLTDIQLKKTNIEGDFLFTPKNCPEINEHIRIDLSENFKLTNFNFEPLFKTVDATCGFHIDLSNSEMLNDDFLEKQAASLIDKTSTRYFHLQLQNTQVNCGRDMMKLRDNPNVKLHGVYCANKRKFLTELTESDLEPTTTSTTPATTLHADLIN